MVKQRARERILKPKGIRLVTGGAGVGGGWGGMGGGDATGFHLLSDRMAQKGLDKCLKQLGKRADS